MNSKREIIGRGKAILLQLMLVAVICPWNALGDATMWIESVDIVPSLPTETDSITFNISGWAGGTPSWVEYDEFLQNGTSLQLDLYIYEAPYHAFSEWTYSRPIATLPADDYNLEINAIDYDTSILHDTYFFEFTVVPEPISIILLGFGLCLLRNVSKRKK
jgi:hypothetical protein